MNNYIKKNDELSNNEKLELGQIVNNEIIDKISVRYTGSYTIHFLRGEVKKIEENKMRTKIK